MYNGNKLSWNSRQFKNTACTVSKQISEEKEQKKKQWIRALSYH